MKKIIFLTMLILISLTSCQSYMFEEAQQAIAPTPSIIKPTDAYSKAVQVEIPVVEEPVALQTELINQTTKEDKERKTLSIVYIPLPSFVMATDVSLIAKRIEQEILDIIAFSGTPIVLEKMKEALSFKVEQLENNTLLVTNLPLISKGYPYSIFTFSNDTPIAVSILDIRENTHYEEALNGEISTSMLLKHPMLEEITSYTSLLTDIPTVVFASLYSPLDSSLLSPFDVLDAYEVTHHKDQLGNGTTLRLNGGREPISLRSDYLFTHNLLPLLSETIDITIAQTKKVPSEERSAISGTFIIE